VLIVDYIIANSEDYLCVLNINCLFSLSADKLQRVFLH